MFKNSAKILFMMILLMSTMISVSANSWLGMWMGLEINLLAFIPLMTDSNNLMSTEASLKYFLTQALASSILLFMIIISMIKYNFYSNMDNEIYSNMIILSSLMLKSGVAPFHFWFPKVMEGLSWMNSFILMTWQKIAPLMIMSYFINPLFFSISIMISILIGSLGGLNQVSLRKIMAFSSINHLGWMLAAMLSSESIWFTYFLIYSFLTMSLIYFFNWFKLFYLNQLFSLFFNNKMIKFSLFMNLLSLGGLPPFLGFFPKWIVIQYLTFNGQLFLMTMMVSMTLITLYFYLRMCYAAFMLNYFENNWLLNIFTNNFILMIYLIMSFFSINGLMLISIYYYII